MISASATSNELSTILKRHDYGASAIDDCIALLGNDKRAKIESLIADAQEQREVEKTDFRRYVVANSRFCNTFNELCDFPISTDYNKEVIFNDHVPIEIGTSTHTFRDGRRQMALDFRLSRETTDRDVEALLAAWKYYRGANVDALPGKIWHDGRSDGEHFARSFLTRTQGRGVLWLASADPVIAPTTQIPPWVA